MKKLVLAATLASILGLSTLANAQSIGHMSLYADSSVRTTELSNLVTADVKGSEVEKGFVSFYTTPKNVNSSQSATSNAKSDNDDNYIVFGVKINSNRQS